MQTIHPAVAALPWWVVWGSVLFYAPVVALISFWTARWSARVMLRPLRKCVEAPWTERARLSFPARMTALLNPVALGTTGFLLGGLVHRPFTALSETQLALVVATAAFLPAVAVAVVQEHALMGLKFHFRSWLRGCLSCLLVFLPHYLVIAITCPLMPRQFSPGAVLGLIFSAFLVWLCARDYNVLLAGKVGLLRPASPRALAAAERAAQRTGIHPRSVTELDWGRANAFAVDNLKLVGFTRGALECLDDDQLEAICAHELGHLAEPAHVRRMRTLSGFALFPIAALQPIGYTFRAPGLLALLVVVLLGSYCYARLSQAKEHDADRTAHGTETDAGVYASALEAIHRASLMPAVLGARTSTHPELYDRLLAAGVQPDYARPTRPPWLRSTWMLVVASFVLTFLAGPLWLGIVYSRNRNISSEKALHWSLALGGGAPELTRLAYRKSKGGDRPTALTFLRAACEVDDRDAYYPALLAAQLAAEGQLPEAEAALKDAKARAARWPRRVTDRAREWLTRANRAIDLSRKPSTRRGPPSPLN